MAFSMSMSANAVGAKSAFMGSKLRLRAPVRTAPIQKVAARAAAIPGEQLITVDKPLGLTLGERKGGNGGVVVTNVAPGGNAAKAGIKAGDTVVYASSFFGEELWPADNLGFVKNALNANPKPEIDFVIVRGAAGEAVNVKRLPKRPAPPRFGRKLTAAQKARATHICLDCGWIWAAPTKFEDQPSDFECPQCNAPKKRFARFNAETGKIEGSGALPQLVNIAGLVGIAGAVALVGIGLLG